MTHDEDGFAALLRTIDRAANVDLAAYKTPCIKRRIAVRMRARAVDSYEAYGRLLRTDPIEVAYLKAAITINVTKFFRNPATWKQLEASILPDMLAGHGGRLQVWSAGCASGEEPYSMAILVAELTRRLGTPSWLKRVRIDATDIDGDCLARARRGWYPASAFTETPKAWHARYTERRGGGFQLVDRIRSVVQVSRLDLTTQPPPAPPYDLILCRNVMIYFDRDTQERLVECFTRSLGPSGILVLGKVEAVWGESRNRLDPIDVRERIFRRSA